MAAIIETRRPTHPLRPVVGPARTPRPALRLVAIDGRRTDVVPIELGIGTAHLVAATVALALLLLLSLAIGNGALAGLAPGPSTTGASTPAAGTPDASASTSSATVRVEAGDTMWSIARRLQPAGDVRALVDRLVELNGTGGLQVGQSVRVPS